jgi:hypothetical protein
VANISDIPVGGGRIYPDRQIVVTQPTANDFKAFKAKVRRGAVVMVGRGTLAAGDHVPEGTGGERRMPGD